MNPTPLLLRQSVFAQRLRSAQLHLPPGLQSLIPPLIVAIIYYVAAQAAFGIGTLSDRIFAPFWPPNVVLFCTLLVVPKRRWWIYILAAFPAHILAESGVGMFMPQTLVAFATNCGVAVLSVWGMFRFLPNPLRFGTLRDAGVYVLITAGVSPAIMAFGGAFVQILGGGGSTSHYWTYWGNWYLANALANVTLAPVVLSWFNVLGREVEWTTRRKTEGIILALGLVVVCASAFTSGAPQVLSSGFLPAVLYSPLPLIFWATFRFGQRGATGAILVVTIVSISENLREPTVFISGSAGTNVLALQVFLMGIAVPVFLLGAAIDELRQSGEATRKLAGAVLRAQDEERRRIARELHDSTGQNLVLAGLIATRVEGMAPPSCTPSVKELRDVLEKAMMEIRTVSYLLHPPLLDAGGLSMALSVYLEGFSKRTGIAVELEISPDFGRLSPHIELVLFRVIQEALTNVWRHSGSSRAWVRLTRQGSEERHQTMLSIEDAGKGISPDIRLGPLSVGTRGQAPAGVGLAGMRERLNQVDGHLEIQSVSGKTVIKATVPIVGRSPD